MPWVWLRYVLDDGRLAASYERDKGIRRTQDLSMFGEEEIARAEENR